MSTRKGTDSTELDKVVDPHDHQELLQDYLEVARLAFERGGRRALELPAPRTSAAHEAGHAVIHAANDNPPYQVAIWHVPIANGYAGECDFGPDAPKFHLDTRIEPRRGLMHAAVLLAGPLSELLLTSDDYRYGSSIDEWLVASRLIGGVAHVLKLDPGNLWERALKVVTWRLTAERAVMVRLQRLLMREGRVRGPKLVDLLAPVHRLDLAAAILFQPRGRQS